MALLKTIEDLETIDLENEHHLISGGCIDSFSILIMVAKIEEQFGVKLQIVDDLEVHLNSVDLIVKLIEMSPKK